VRSTTPLLLAALLCAGCGGNGGGTSGAGGAATAPAGAAPPSAASPPAPAPAVTPPAPAAAATAGGCAAFDLGRIQHIVVIYQENWSFDGLYRKFPGASGWSDEDPVAQVDAHGEEIARLPQPLLKGRAEPYAAGRTGEPDPRFPGAMPMRTYDLAPFVPADQLTGDLIHAFYTEQAEIHGGRMDRFVAGSDNPGLVLGCYDATGFPEGRLAREFTMCDHCFHSAFGGSFINHQWMIAARTPPWPVDVPAPEAWRSRVPQGIDDVDHLQDRPLSADGAYVVNTAQPANTPAGDGPRLPRLLEYRTIGDALDEAKLEWAWFAGGWRRADAAGDGYRRPDLFQVHHQPFLYFRNFDAATAAGRANRATHLKDEDDFVAAARAGTLPAVAFVKPMGRLNEHPGYSDLVAGQAHAAALVEAVRSGPEWASTVIIITYDEHGGRWDHLAPPVEDQWGPGTRVPMIVVSPFARRGAVDHDVVESVSVLRLIEERWHLAPLGSRDAHAGSLIGAFAADAPALR
jgi:acid phosphatase